MSTIDLEMSYIKNIFQCHIELEYSKGIYALVGTNGCGKSTIMQSLSLLVKPSSRRSFSDYDLHNDSLIKITVDGKEHLWAYDTKHQCLTQTVETLSNQYHGFYEGSIFYGSRFNDYNVIINSRCPRNIEKIVRDGDDFVKDNMSLILHGDTSHYRTLKKISSKTIASNIGFTGIPYFFESNGNLINQFRMSSGECMLISLIDFVNNITSRRSYPDGAKIIFLIDEVELALHPSAIDRLIKFFNDLIKTSSYEIIVYFSTHSSEVIQKIDPKNIHLIENENGTIYSTNPCYPNYAVRNLYIPNGFDFLILVEDELAKALVEKTIRDNNLCKSKLWHVLPAGGWSQLLKLHKDILTNNILGVGKKLISIYDGDAKSLVAAKQEYNNLPKTFLPINSLEKYLKRKIITENDRSFIKILGDKYFNQRSLTDIVSDYKLDTRSQKDSTGKGLYKVLAANLESNGIDEKQFIKYLCEDIALYENLSSFTTAITALLS